MRKITFLIAGVMLALLPLKTNAQQRGTPEEAVALVKRTIAAIQEDGIEAVIKAVNNKDSNFRDRDLYVFIGNLKVPGQLVAHANNVKLTKKNTINIKDENGKYFAREMWDVAETKGSGWVDYRWANANRTEFADKTSYIERVDDYFVSVGVYKVDAPNENTVGIISGNPDSAPTYLQFAYDMAVVLNDGYNLRVVPVVGMGGVQNIRDVRSLKGIDIGLTQLNILNSYRDTLKSQVDGEDDKIVYIANLFSEEVHLLARKDIKSLSELRGQKVNIDISGSGTAFTMRDILNNLGIDIQEVNLNQASAIEKLKTGEIAATALVAGKPVLSIQSTSSEYGFHLLPIPYDSALQKVYLPNQFTSNDYPGLIGEGESVETVAVSTVLIAYNWSKSSDSYDRVKKFVEALFKKFDRFLEPSLHPKWRNVNLASTLPGWDRFEAAEEILAAQGKLVVKDTIPALPSNRVSFESFLAQRGVLANISPEERQKLFSEFLQWAEGRQ